MVKPAASTPGAAGGARAAAAGRSRAQTAVAAPAEPLSHTPDPLAPVGGLPWLAEPLAAALSQRRAHALLVHGPDGVGQFEFALALARAWLCEAPDPERPDAAQFMAPLDAPSSADAPTPEDGSAGPARQPVRLACGHCVSCRLIDSRSHPDLRLIVPESMRAMAGLAGDETEDAGDGAARKRKPSREIKVEQIRSALDFSELSGARSGLRVVLLHPAEQLNVIAANTLLKTLEEPVGDLRFILSCGAPAALLPTVRSRCQALRLGLPPRALARRWLQGRLALDGVDADVLLDACGDQALAAQALADIGLGAQAWRDLPGQLSRGDAAALAHWPLPEFVLALQKLCVDLTLQTLGAPPRHFPAQALVALGGLATSGPRGAAVQSAAPSRSPAQQRERLLRLTAWAADLRARSRSAEHPWSASLAVEALVLSAQGAACD
jgi:DNA polymerase-3 subunit delta'